MIHSLWTILLVMCKQQYIFDGSGIVIEVDGGITVHQSTGLDSSKRLPSVFVNVSLQVGVIKLIIDS